MTNTIFWAGRAMLGMPYIIFGLNKFIGFVSVDPPADEQALMYLGAMFSTYLYKLVGITEILGGALILIPRTTFLGSILLLPVTTNIVAFHLAHDLPGNGLWLIPMIAHLFILYLYRKPLQNLSTLSI